MITLEVLLVAILLGWLYALIFARWQRGLYWLVTYLPFAGAVTIALNLWWASLLFKDIFFVIPLYIAFFARFVFVSECLTGFPRRVAYLMLCLLILTIVQARNSGVANPIMALIGLKVWLFYIPICLVAYAFVDSFERMLGLFRLLVVLSFIPAAVALVEILMVHQFGYLTAMQMVYGAAASEATQGFSVFRVGQGSFGRIPSVFTFETQFLGYSLAMLIPAYVLWRADPSPRWRRLGSCALLTAALDTLLSGSRGAYIFTPLILTLVFLFDRGVAGLLAAICGAAVLTWTTAGAIFGIALWHMYGVVGGLFSDYARSAAYGGLVQAIAAAPLGMGTGTNTGAARYALADPDAFIGIENYYAKAAYELGIPGLLVVAGLFLTIIFISLKARGKMLTPNLRCGANALLAFLVAIFLISFKGWQIDLDPVNVYYWLFAGILLKLPILEESLLWRQWRLSEAYDHAALRPVA
jgi:hypothetical protein